MHSPTPLENEFHKEMLAIYQTARSECGYNATRFLNMVANNGGLKTAKRLLANEIPSDGFIELVTRCRIDLTVEALVVKEKYRSLFDQREIQIALNRHDEYGCEIK